MFIITATDYFTKWVEAIPLCSTYNDMVKPRSFNQGDLVLHKNQQKVNYEITKKGKFSPNWLGPYIVAEIYGSGAYRLTKMDGTPLREPINVVHLH